MDQIPAPGPPRIFHIRITSILFLLTLIDILLVTYSLESIAFNGVSSMVLFASEFVILLASVSGTFARYWIGVADLWRARGREDAPSWEQKSMYLFYVDLAVGERHRSINELSSRQILSNCSPTSPSSQSSSFTTACPYISFVMCT